MIIMVGTFKSIDMNEDKNYYKAKNLTFYIPAELEEDQENKIKEIFDKVDELENQYNKNSRAKDYIKFECDGFKTDYIHRATRSNKDDIKGSLNSVIKDYTNTFNDLSDEKVMNAILITSGLPVKFKEEQKNQLIKLFNKIETLREKYKYDDKVKNDINSNYKGFLNEYTEIIRWNSELNSGNNEVGYGYEKIGKEESKLNRVIETYDVIFDYISDENKKDKFMR